MVLLPIQITAQAYLLSTVINPDRERYPSYDSQASQHRIARSQTKRVEHLLSKERERKAHERTQHGGGCHCGRSVSERVDEVELNGEERAHHGEAEDSRSDNR